MKVILLTLALASLLMASGCLTSEEPFYEKSDLKTDDRLVGIFRFEKDEGNWEITKSIDSNDLYFMTYVNDRSPCSMKFFARYFQVGTNNFMNLFPYLEACDHVAGSSPSPIEFLQGVMIQPLNMVIKCEITAKGLNVGIADNNTLISVARRNLNLFKPNGGELPRMVGDTKRQRDFLLRAGGNTNLFKMVAVQRQEKKTP